MGNTLWAYFRSFIPRELQGEISVGDPETIRQVNLFSLALIVLVFVVFALTYSVCVVRFDRTLNSFHMPDFTPLILLWGGVSGFLYYALDINKTLPYILPGVIIGGGFYLGVTTFSLELTFPGIAIQAGLATFCTVLVAQILCVMKVLDRYVWLESAMIMTGSILMNVVITFVMYKSGLSLYTKVPEYMDPFSFYTKIVFVSLVVIVLMSFLALFHLDHLRKLSKPKMTFLAKLHLAANALFVVFFLYTAFLFLFAVGRSKK